MPERVDCSGFVAPMSGGYGMRWAYRRASSPEMFSRLARALRRAADLGSLAARPRLIVLNNPWSCTVLRRSSCDLTMSFVIFDLHLFDFGPKPFRPLWPSKAGQKAGHAAPGTGRNAVEEAARSPRETGLRRVALTCTLGQGCGWSGFGSETNIGR